MDAAEARYDVPAEKEKKKKKKTTKKVDDISCDSRTCQRVYIINILIIIIITSRYILNNRFGILITIIKLIFR